MSQISQKSITGITSITTPVGTDDVFTVHSGDTTERFRVDQSGNQNISGIVTATNFKTGSSNLHSTGLTVGDTFVHATGVNGSSADIDDFISVGNNIHLGNAGVITATSFVGDGSDLTNLPAGLGTALSATATSPLNKMYYTNQVLGVPSSVTVDVPASASKAYTQYADIKVDGSADLIIAEGDDLIPDVLGLADFGTFGGGASAGRIRVNSISNAANDGSPTVQKGLVVTGVCTATSFSGSGANLTNLPAQATIANNADNRVITGGSGVNLNGEANLTFDGDSLLLLSSTNGRRVSFAGGGTSHYMKFDNTLNGIILNGYGGIAFETNGTNERLRITSSGTVNLGGNYTQTTFKAQIQTGTNKFISFGSAAHDDLSNEGSGIIFSRQSDGAKSLSGIFGHSNTSLGIAARDSLTFHAGGTSTYSAAPERLRITSTGVISFDQGTTAAVTPSQSTASSIGHQTMSGGTNWFNHANGIDYFGVDGDWKLTNGATYGKIVARNTQGAINNAEQAGHTWFMVCKTVAGTLGNSNWVVEPVAGWKMAWPVPLIAGGVATFYMRDAVESFGSPTIPASGDYYIGWFFSVSQDMGTNGGDYYVDATSGGKIYYYSGEGDMSNPHQRIPRQGDSWDAYNTGEKIHFRFETLPKADLTGTVFASPLLVDPVMQGVPLIDGLPMAGGQLVKDVQWATNTSSVEFMNADFVNCNYLVTYSINGSDGSSNSTGWFQTRLQFCDHDGSFYAGTNDYISHCEWCDSTSTSPTINSNYAGLQRSIWLTGNGASYDHEGYVWIIPSNFRHNRDSTISQRWSQDIETIANTHPRILVRGHSFLSSGSAGQHYREEGGGTYRGTNGIFNISGFRLYGSASSNFHTPASNGSSNGYVRIWRFKSGFEAREVS